METKPYKSQKQIDNEIQEELKQLRKDNSQLLEQNRELVEALKGLIKDYPYAKGMVEIKELLTKHSKDV